MPSTHRRRRWPRSHQSRRANHDQDSGSLGMNWDFDILFLFYIFIFSQKQGEMYQLAILMQPYMVDFVISSL